MTKPTSAAGTDENRRKRFDCEIPAIVFAGLGLTLPCLLYGFPFYGDDSVSSAIFYREFAEQFWSGEVYPRWLQGLNGGLGNPTAFVYAPLAYWLTSPLKVLIGNDLQGWRQLGVSAAIAVVASGLVVFFWLRRSVDARAALLASLMYLILPYHINIDLYARGALAELWTFVWMPLVLWAVDTAIARRRFAVFGLAGSYAMLVMTHLPTTLIFSLIPIVYSLCLAPQGEKLRAFLLTNLGMLLGVGLSAIYLLPAMAMQEFVFHTTQGIGGHYYFGNWFLFTQLKWIGRYSEYFLAATEVLVLASVAFATGRIGLLDYPRKKSVFWFGVTLCCFFMMTPLSKPIWQLLPTLQKVQFPFRFNTALSLAVAPLTALALANGKTPRKQWTILLGIFLIFAGTWGYATAFRAYYAYPAHYVDQSVLDYSSKRFQQRRDTNEFRPRWVVSIEPPELEALLQRIGQRDGELNKVSVVKGESVVTVEKWRPREIVLQVDTPEGASLNLSRFYFPGWFVQIDDAQDKHAVQPSKPGGLITVDVPAGQHRLTLQLGKRKAEVAGQIISAVSLLIWLTLLCSVVTSRMRHRERLFLAGQSQRSN